MKEYKILLTGTMGAGKTTAISMISDVAPVLTEVQNNDPSHSKQTTTVGLDYGELTLASGERLRLYGTPGQERFRFMWKILAQGALGLLILLDHSSPEPFKELSLYLSNFSELIASGACVVAVGRLCPENFNVLDEYARLTKEHGVICPVVAVDVREKDQVLNLLDLLFLQLENKVAKA